MAATDSIDQASAPKLGPTAVVASAAFTRSDAIFWNIVLAWILWTLWTETAPFPQTDLLIQVLVCCLVKIIHDPWSTYWIWPAVIVVCTVMSALLRLLLRAICFRRRRAFIPIPRTWRDLAFATAIVPLIAVIVGCNAIGLECSGGRISSATTVEAAISEAGWEPINVHLDPGAMSAHLDEAAYKPRNRDLRRYPQTVSISGDLPTIAMITYPIADSQPDPTPHDSFTGTVILSPVPSRVFFGLSVYCPTRVPESLFLPLFIANTTVREYVAPAAIVSLLILAAYGAILAKAFARKP